MSNPVEYYMLQQRRRDEQLQNIFNMALQAYQTRRREGEQQTQNQFEERRVAAYEKAVEPRPAQLPQPPKKPWEAKGLKSAEDYFGFLRDEAKAKANPLSGGKPIAPTYTKTIAGVSSRLQLASNRLRDEYAKLRGNPMLAASTEAKKRVAELEADLSKIQRHESMIYELETRIQSGYKPTQKELEYLYQVTREIPTWGVSTRTK